MQYSEEIFVTTKEFVHTLSPPEPHNYLRVDSTDNAATCKSSTPPNIFLIDSAVSSDN